MMKFGSKHAVLRTVLDKNSNYSLKKKLYFLFLKLHIDVKGTVFL